MHTDLISSNSRGNVLRIFVFGSACNSVSLKYSASDVSHTATLLRKISSSRAGDLRILSRYAIETVQLNVEGALLHVWEPQLS